MTMTLRTPDSFNFNSEPPPCYANVYGADALTLEDLTEEAHSAAVETERADLSTFQEWVESLAKLHKRDAPAAADILAWLVEQDGCPPAALTEGSERLTTLIERDAVWHVGARGLFAVIGDSAVVPLHMMHEIWKVERERAIARRSETRPEHPLNPIIDAYLSRPMELMSRHLQTVKGSGGRRYTKTPALLSAVSGRLEIVRVDGEPFAGRQPQMPAGAKPRGYKPVKGQQRELLPRPARINGIPANDLLLVGLDQWDLSEDARATLRHDIARLGRAAYALTGAAVIPEDVGVRWLTGQERVTEAGMRRWWDTLRAMRWMTITMDKTGHWLDMFDVAPLTDRAAHIGPPTWWIQNRAGSGPRAWRLSGSLWRRPLYGDAPSQGTAAGYWGALARTIDGIEAALTWGPTSGRGKGARVPTYLKPTRAGGPGPKVIIPWRNVLRLSGENAPDDSQSSTLRERYRQRVAAFVDAGYMTPTHGGEAPASDTIEVVSVVNGRGRGREAGLIVRASARFVEAYQLGQDSRHFQLLPAADLFTPDV